MAFRGSTTLIEPLYIPACISLLTYPCLQTWYYVVWNSLQSTRNELYIVLAVWYYYSSDLVVRQSSTTYSYYMCLEDTVLVLVVSVDVLEYHGPQSRFILGLIVLILTYGCYWYELPILVLLSPLPPVLELLLLLLSQGGISTGFHWVPLSTSIISSIWPFKSKQLNNCSTRL